MALSVKFNASKLSVNIFLFTVLLAMYASMQLYFTWSIPAFIISLLSLFSTSFYLIFNKVEITKKRFISAILIIFVFIYEGIMIYPISVISMIALFSRILMTITLIFSRNEILEVLLKLIIRVTAAIILFSLVFWILFLIGFSFPYYRVRTNNYYEHSVYYFFILNGLENQLTPRFAGWFLEPGHVGSTSCLLLLLNGVSIKKWENVVFIVAIILSLSLAAYGLLVGCIGLHYLTTSKRFFIKLIPYIFILGTLTIFFMNYNKGDNPINEKILMRLVFENGEMSGSNRTSMLFDRQYEKYIHSKESIFGKSRSLPDNHSQTGWLTGCATWKRYFFLRGYVGLSLLLIFLGYYSLSNYSKKTLSFLVLYIVCNMIRDYPLDELWLYLVIVSFPIYDYRLKFKSYEKV